MANKKTYIIAVKNGVCIGYIKSVSYKNGTFQLTSTKDNAKGYVSEGRLHDEIDALTAIGAMQGYTFICN